MAMQLAPSRRIVWPLHREKSATGTRSPTCLPRVKYKASLKKSHITRWLLKFSTLTVPVPQYIACVQRSTMRRAHSPLKYLVSPAAGCVSCVSIRPQSAVSMVFSSANTSTSSSSAASLLPPGVPRYAVRTARPRLAHVQHTYSNTPPGQSVLRRRWLRYAGGRYAYPVRAARLRHSMATCQHRLPPLSIMKAAATSRADSPPQSMHES